jgi:hypothetical protein
MPDYLPLRDGSEGDAARTCAHDWSLLEAENVSARTWGITLRCLHCGVLDINIHMLDGGWVGARGAWCAEYRERLQERWQR